MRRIVFNTQLCSLLPVDKMIDNVLGKGGYYVFALITHTCPSLIPRPENEANTCPCFEPFTHQECIRMTLKPVGILPPILK